MEDDEDGNADNPFAEVMESPAAERYNAACEAIRSLHAAGRKAALYCMAEENLTPLRPYNDLVQDALVKLVAYKAQVEAHLCVSINQLNDELDEIVNLGNNNHRIAEERSAEIDQLRSMARHMAETIKDLKRERVSTSVVTEIFDPRGFFVYVLWGESAERPVYVGKSSNILARLGTHMGNAEKRSLTVRVELFRCDDKDHMDNLERDLIRQHQPMLNIMGVTQAPDSVAELTASSAELDPFSSSAHTPF